MGETQIKTQTETQIQNQGKDKAGKVFFRRKQNVVDLLNLQLYGGRKVVSSEDVVVLDGGQYVVQLSSADYEWSASRYRDIIYECNLGEEGKKRKVQFGIEVQSRTDKLMVLRNMEYDLNQYKQQAMDREVKELKPVFSIVVNWGMGPWSGPTSLYEMFDKGQGGIPAFIQNFQLFLFETFDIEDEVLLNGDNELCFILFCIKHRKEPELIIDMMAHKIPRGYLSVGALLVLREYLGMKIDFDENEGEYEMSELWDNIVKLLKKEGLEEGREEGREEGLERGRQLAKKEAAETRVKQILEAIRRSVEWQRPMEDICFYLGCSMDEIRDIAQKNNIVLS